MRPYRVAPKSLLRESDFPDRMKLRAMLFAISKCINGAQGWLVYIDSPTKSSRGVKKTRNSKSKKFMARGLLKLKARQKQSRGEPRPTAQTGQARRSFTKLGFSHSSFFHFSSLWLCWTNPRLLSLMVSLYNNFVLFPSLHDYLPTNLSIP